MNYKNYRNWWNFKKMLKVFQERFEQSFRHSVEFFFTGTNLRKLSRNIGKILRFFKQLKHF